MSTSSKKTSKEASHQGKGASQRSRKGPPAKEAPVTFSDKLRKEIFNARCTAVVRFDGVETTIKIINQQGTEMSYAEFLFSIAGEKKALELSSRKDSIAKRAAAYDGQLELGPILSPLSARELDAWVASRDPSFRRILTMNASSFRSYCRKEKEPSAEEVDELEEACIAAGIEGAGYGSDYSGLDYEACVGAIPGVLSSVPEGTQKSKSNA